MADTRQLKQLVLIGLLSVSIHLAVAQDIHFSQFYQAPLAVNPALTGVFNGEIRAVLNYRNQWPSIRDAYTTYGASYDMGLLKKKMNNKFIGAGLFLYNDVAGGSKLRTTEANFSLSSVISVNDKHDLSAGLQGGIAQKSIDESNLKWDKQFDGSVFNSSLPSGEPVNFENYIYGDFSTGLAWSYGKDGTNMSSNDHFGANAGLAVYHINSPKQNYDVEDLHRELVMHGSAYIGIKNTDLSLLPYLLYLQQGPLSQVNAGALIRYSIREESKYTGFLKETAIFLGLYVRVGDALIPSFLFEMANYAIGLSYDVNTSGLKEASSGNGGLEISIRYINPNPFKYGKGTRYQHKSMF